MLLAAAAQRSRLNLVSAREGISRGPRQISREAGASWQDPCGVISPANWGERAARLPETARLRRGCPPGWCRVVPLAGNGALPGVGLSPLLRAVPRVVPGGISDGAFGLNTSLGSSI